MNLGLINREQLASVGQFLVDELDSMVARIRATWNIEHTPEGAHTDITARSLTLTANADTGATGDVIADGDGTFDGAVTAHADTAAQRVSIGTQSESAIDDGGGGPGIEMGAGADRVAMYSSSEGSDDYIKFTFGSITPFLLRRTGAELFFQPGPNSNILNDINLGGNRDTRDRWNALYVRNGVFEAGRAAAAGYYTDVAFNAANYTGNGSMTWTLIAANVKTHHWQINGKSLMVDVYIDGGTVGGVANTALQIPIPGGFVSAKAKIRPCRIVSGGVGAAGLMFVAAGGTVIQIYAAQNFTTNWTAGTVEVQGDIEFEVQ